MSGMNCFRSRICINDHRYDVHSPLLASHKENKVMSVLFCAVIVIVAKTAVKSNIRVPSTRSVPAQVTFNSKLHKETCLSFVRQAYTYVRRKEDTINRSYSLVDDRV
jgi:hypothetical protein